MRQTAREFTAGHQLLALPGTSHRSLQDGNPALPRMEQGRSVCGKEGCTIPDSTFSLGDQDQVKNQFPTAGQGEKASHPESL